MTDVTSQIVDAWNTISDAYLARYDFSTDSISYGPMCPTESELKLLGELNGKRLLDIGCGAGHNSIAFAQAGAQVTAIDPSATQLQAAIKLAEEKAVDINFINIKAQEISLLDPSFDIAFSSYAMMFVDDIQAVFKQMHRLLAPNGVFAICVDHPLRLSGEWNQKGEFVVQGYFNTGWQSWNYAFPDQQAEVTMHRYHRTFQNWFEAIANANLTIRTLIEPKPSKLPDSFAIKSKYGDNDERNIFHPSNLQKVPGSLILHGVKL